MGYRYETHLHTSQSSRCGRSTGAEHARFYKKLGYTGVIVTDHFFGGNTAASRTGCWQKRIEEFCAGYEDCKAEGDRIGLDVFFGWEESFEGDDYLIYGLDKAWLLAHPEVEHYTRREQFDAVHAAGGCIIQAHPFRCRNYIKKVHLGLGAVDGIEVANVGNDALFDYYALRYAREFGALMTAGSDNHFSADGEQIYGIETEQKLETIHDYVRQILTHQQPRLIVPEERFAQPTDRQLPLSCWIVDTSGHKTRYRRPWLFDKES